MVSHLPAGHSPPGRQMPSTHSNPLGQISSLPIGHVGKQNPLPQTISKSGWSQSESSVHGVNTQTPPTHSYPGGQLAVTVQSPPPGPPGRKSNPLKVSTLLPNWLAVKIIFSCAGEAGKSSGSVLITRGPSFTNPSFGVSGKQIKSPLPISKQLNPSAQGVPLGSQVG